MNSALIVPGAHPGSKQKFVFVLMNVMQNVHPKIESKRTDPDWHGCRSKGVFETNITRNFVNAFDMNRNGWEAAEALARINML